VQEEDEEGANPKRKLGKSLK